METARLFHYIKRAGEMGLRVCEPQVDWPTLMARKDDLVNYLRMGTEALLRSNGVELVQAQALMEGPRIIRAKDRQYTVSHVVIATGSKWYPPKLNGIGPDELLTSDDLTEMREIPSSAIVLGSGPVELEMAQYLLFMGCSVTLLEEGGRILINQDREMAGRMAVVLKEQGIEVLTGVRVKEVIRGEDYLEVRMEGQRGGLTRKAQRIFHARRAPRLDGIDRRALNVKREEHGIPVDRRLETELEGVFAVGDVTGGDMYSHRATSMGIMAAENALGAEKRWDESRVPRAYFTWPELASVGMTEREAKEKGLKIRTATIPFSINPRAMMRLETAGAVKVVADAEYGEVLGVHILGPWATELISEAVLAMEMEATLEELARAILIHPTLSESQVEAAREALGRGLYVLR
jgi:dihydrolipoamide dehydrogenase